MVSLSSSRPLDRVSAVATAKAKGDLFVSINRLQMSWFAMRFKNTVDDISLDHFDGVEDDEDEGDVVVAVKAAKRGPRRSFNRSGCWCRWQLAVTEKTKEENE
jgi:hypothetical protein